MKPKLSEPAERSETLRKALAAALRERALTARELSGAVSISERDVSAHLEHLERSLTKSHERLVVEPATCRTCGYVFAGRQRHSRPSRCPKCRGERLSAPRFCIKAAAT